jgi:two-component system, cell cycle sensor histidine kinase and response regulator CckA
MLQNSKRDAIARRLTVSFCLLILFFFLFGLYTLLEIRTLSAVARTIYDHPLAVSNAALQADVSVTKIHRNMKDVVLFEDPERIRISIDAVNFEEGEVYRNLDIAKMRILGEEGKKLEIETRALFAAWKPIREEVIRLVRSGQRDKAAEITIGKGSDHVAKLEDKLAEMTDYARSKAASFMEEVQKTRSRLQKISFSFLLIVLILSSLIAFFSIKNTAASEKRLRDSEERLQLVIKGSNDAPWDWDLIRNEIYYSPQWWEQLGYAPDELSADVALWERLMHPEDAERANSVFKSALEKDVDSYEVEFRLKHKDGHFVSILSRGFITRDGSGNATRVSGTNMDLTERKLAEERIEHLNRVLRAIRDVNQLIVRERDPETLIREGCRLLVDNRGYAAALIVLTDENDRPLSWAGAGFASSSEAIDALFDRQELPPCCDKARPAVEVARIDYGAGTCSACPVGEKCSGTPSLCVRLIHGDTSFGYLMASLDPDLQPTDEESSLFLEMAGDLAYALNFIRMEAVHESSEKQRESLEKQLVQAQKMESVGRLAGGVAHDYNNMLSIITGYAELALEKVSPEDPLYADIREISQAAKRSTDITRQLLAFARKQTTAPKVLDLNENIGRMLKMLRRLIGEDIDLSWRPGEALGLVKIDPSQVDQILANLCVNARDAIAGVGKITIETDNIRFDENYCADHPGFIPGDFVLVAVSDDGAGMATETLDKIFEPFFTTKNDHRGTGLGLATVYGIVKQNSGFINVYSEPEKGTTIKIYLPHHTGGTAWIQPENTLAALPGDGETILLAEDDASILKLGKMFLESLGYTVLSANTSHEAIRLAEEHPGDIQLLITDVVMPEMNGRELSESLRTRYPDLKTLFMSGYTANVIAHRGVLEEGVFFIAKPFSKNDLAVKVREVLNDTGT